jgi:hypothetical protein
MQMEIDSEARSFEALTDSFQLKFQALARGTLPFESKVRPQEQEVGTKDMN